mmetsp:Transcript_21927/g.68588  ORF Transcript_21927/g.68588 Transcript_21927/m.68588 type:complete len:159 (+) Transcript_21927:641-1117(+)
MMLVRERCQDWLLDKLSRKPASPKQCFRDSMEAFDNTNDPGSLVFQDTAGARLALLNKYCGLFFYDSRKEAGVRYDEHFMIIATEWFSGNDDGPACNVAVCLQLNVVPAQAVAQDQKENPLHHRYAFGDELLEMIRRSPYNTRFCFSSDVSLPGWAPT